MLVETVGRKRPEPICFFDPNEDPLDAARGIASGILLGLASWLVIAGIWFAGSAVTGLTLAAW